MTAQQTRKTPSQNRKNAWIVATGVTMVVYLIAMLSAFATGAPWLIWIGLGAGALMIVAACGWAATLDEAAKQAHYISWYWGGSAGIVFSFLAYLVLLPLLIRPGEFERVLAVLPGLPAVPMSFTLGLLLGIVPAVIGYVIWWCVLWLRRN